MSELASIIIVTYNCKDYMKACLDSMLSQDYPHEIIIVDNASEDGTVEYVKENYPDILVVETGSDLGYGRGNNIGVKSANGKYVVIINPDVIVSPGWLRELVTPLIGHPKKVTVPKSISWDGKQIYSAGLVLHPIGLCGSTVYGLDSTELQDVMDVTGISGVCFAMAKSSYQEIGGFDDNIFLYGEDLELSWKIFLNDYTAQLIPTAVIRHDWQSSVSPNKIYYIEWGRYYLLKKYYTKKDKLLLLPSMVLTEILAMSYALSLGINGLKMQRKARRDIRKMNIPYVKGNRKSLLLKLYPKLPPEIVEIRCPKIFRYTAIPIINAIYSINYVLYLKIKTS